MGRIRTDQTARFWNAVDKTEQCWTWKLATTTAGYGTFRATEPVRKMVSAHRFSYELSEGPIPAGLAVDHICHTRSCVRPDHLRVVTSKQNSEHQAQASNRAKSGVRGVIWVASRGVWRPQVRHNGKLYFGKQSTTIAEAAREVVEIRNRLYTHNNLDRAQAEESTYTTPTV